MIRRFVGLVIVVFVSMMYSLAMQDVPSNQQSENDRADSSQAAIIKDSGSTNTPGYRLIVYASGKAEWTLSRRRNSPVCSRSKGKLSPDLAQRFFQDLRGLMPLSNLPVEHCVKSASFGRTLRLSYGGTESPDLTCAASGTGAEKLRDDLSEINTALGISKNAKSLQP